MTTDIHVHPLDRVISALDELADAYPELETAVDFYEEVLPLMAQARPSLDGLQIDRAQVGQKLGQGVPLLWGEFGGAGAVGMSPHMELFVTLCRLAAEGGNQDGQRFMTAVLEGNLDLNALLGAMLTLDKATLTRAARSFHMELLTVETILRYLLMPITRAYADAFRQAFDFSEWGQGYCPVCGDWPLLGELRGRDKWRHLRCGRCGAGWRFQRLRCVWCDNTQQSTLSFLFEPEDKRWRIDVCEQCHGYVKTLVSFDALDTDMLLVHDLRTTFMDQTAVEAGYQRLFKRPLSTP